MPSVTGHTWEWGSLRQSALSCLQAGCPACCPMLVPTAPCHPYHTHNAPSAQKEKEKKKAKYDSLQDLRKNKKELEFEQKLYKEKEEMLEKEKQLKINRLAQEVCAQLQGCVHCLTTSKGQLGSFSTDEYKDRPILPSLEITTAPPTHGHLRPALDVC